MKVRTGKFRRVREMSQDEWLATPIWEVKLRSDDNYWARPVLEPARITGELLRGRRIVVVARCEQSGRDALAEVRSLRQLGDISIFWRGRMTAADRLAAAKFPFQVVAVPPFGRDSEVRFVCRMKRSRCANRV
jgi:hypothetical protein